MLCIEIGCSWVQNSFGFHSLVHIHLVFGLGSKKIEEQKQKQKQKEKRIKRKEKGSKKGSLKDFQGLHHL